MVIHKYLILELLSDGLKESLNEKATSKVVWGEGMKKDQRGFYIYSEFKDSYGSSIQIKESSSAMGPRVWIFCNREGTIEDPAPHLNVTQAKRLIKGLQKFIDQVPIRWSR